MRGVVTIALIGMLVIFAVYATSMITELSKKITYIGELEATVDIMGDTVSKQAELLEQAKADKQQLVSGWHVREIELQGKIFTLETCGAKGVRDLEGIRDELRKVLEGFPEYHQYFTETLKLIAQAKNKLFTVFVANVSIQPLMLGHPTQSAQFYESGEWSYALFVEDIGTEKVCVTGRLIEDRFPVEPVEDGHAAITQVETPWGIMYWHGEDRENGRIGWHKDIALDGLWTPVDDPTVEVE